MNRSIFFLHLFLWCGLAISANAQEICNNGIDDDNDGFIDCFDSDCVNNKLCDGNYIGNDALCEAKPSGFPGFKMKLDWASPNRVTTHQSRMSIGDLDRNGIPEVVVSNRNDQTLTILNGANGAIKKQIGVPFDIDRDVAIANINNDACAEIFAQGWDGNNYYIYSYNCDLTAQLWRSSALPGDPGLLGLADFNGDGKTELYFRGMIIDAHTGKTIAKAPGTFTDLPGSSVAVDITGNSDLELVCGLSI